MSQKWNAQIYDILKVKNFHNLNESKNESMNRVFRCWGFWINSSQISPLEDAVPVLIHEIGANMVLALKCTNV